MGSMMSAIYDDKEEWADLKQKAGIDDVLWDVYSREACNATIGFNEEGYTGVRLKLYVKHCCEIETLRFKQATELGEFTQLQKLQEKFA